ncbi:MAG: methyltransferase domain-containing protein [Kiritimatiellae bacterium]|nr:methyltransferase domain-containing protein [Kiritimatiellia bacterium]
MKELSVQGIVELASAYYGSAVLFAALEIDLFSLVGAAEAATVAEISAKHGFSPRGLRLLMDACVAVGLLAKEGDRYRNTRTGSVSLVSGAPHDLTRAIRYNYDVYPLWGKLAQLVRNGDPVEPPSKHLGDDPTRTRAFALSMHGRAMGIGKSVIPLLDLNGCSRVLDLAGGPGTYAMLMAEANPSASFVTVDLPAIAEVAKELVGQAGLASRVECRAGDYHTDVYEENAYDAVTIFGALHQESPEHIVSILKRANRALKSGGKIFVLDMMTDSTHTSPSFSALFGVNMALTMPEGWVFSDSELYGWLREAGFDDCRTQPVPPPMPHWLVSAVSRR